MECRPRHASLSRFYLKKKPEPEPNNPHHPPIIFFFLFLFLFLFRMLFRFRFSRLTAPPLSTTPPFFMPSLLLLLLSPLLFCVAMESHFILSSHFFFIVLHPLTCAHSRTRHAFLRHRYIFLWLPGLLQLPLLLKKKRSGRSKRSAACCPQYPAVRWIGLLLSPSSKIVNSVARVSLLAVGFGWLRRFPTSFTLRKRRRRAR